MADPTRTAQVRDALWRLLPRGLVWTRRPGGVRDRLLEAIATELVLVKDRAAELRHEKPLTTVELLEDWEELLALPDPLVTAEVPQTADARRDAVVAKLSALENQAPATLEALAARLGFTITIEECAPFVAGPAVGEPLTGVGHAGDPLNGEDWAYAFKVHAPPILITEFRAGISRAGDALREWSNVPFEAAINRAKPSHTIPVYEYA